MTALWLLPLRALWPQFVAFGQALPKIAATFVSLAPAPAQLGQLAAGAWQVEGGLVVTLSTLGLMVVLSPFWLGSSDTLGTFILSLLPPHRRSDGAQLFRELGERLGAYVRTTVVNGFVLGTECAVLLSLLHVPFALVLAVGQGVSVALPYVGTLIAVLTVGAVAMPLHGPAGAIGIMLALSLVHSLHGTFIAPLIFKQGAGVDPLSSIIALAIGGALFGFFGVLLALPAASVIEVLAVRVVAPAIRRSWAFASPEADR